MRQPANRPQNHPGEILRDYLEGYHITQAALAKHIGVTPAHINEIVQGKRGITPKVAIALAGALGTTPIFWLNMQSAFDIYKVSQNKAQNATEIAPIIPQEALISA
ncbi:MAG: HigA family addiction module antitoxin [Candidatus Melainabacteria bacterium]|nr:HigA family addiction module antitoxin [Candidatus Melainabacteria bacterium]